MNLRDQIARNPFSWKDWIAAGALAFTVATVLVQGGRIIEQQQSANKNIAELTSKMTSMQVDVINQRGIDRLHDEQIHTLRKDVDRYMVRETLK